MGLVFSAYSDDLGYLPTFHFVLIHFTFNTFMLSILPELDHYLLLSHASHHDTWPYTSISQLGEDVDQSSISLVFFSYILWTLGSTSSMMTGLEKLLIYSDYAFILTVGMFSVDLLALCISSTGHHCFYSSVILVLSAWYHDTWSCLALPIWGWTFSLHDGWAYFKVQ